MRLKHTHWLLHFLLLGAIPVFSQVKKVELIRANSLEGTVYMGQPIRKLKGNVVFQHAGAKMYCDSSYQYELRNDLEAFDHIRIVKSDSQSLTGDRMVYYGDQRLAKITGRKVVLINKTLNLTTTILDYNLETDIANYYNQGTVVDKENKLVSQIGTYYKHQNLFVFIKNVVFTDQKYTIYTDTMEYNTLTKIVKFRGPTRIIGPDGDMNADEGEYNSVTKESAFKGRTKINYGVYLLVADKVRYDQRLQKGIAIGNVEIFSKKDSVTIYGQQAHYSGGQTTRTKVFPQALMQMVNGGDTLFLTGDTLFALRDTVAKIQRMHCYYKVKVFNKNMQAICDSLVNDVQDSTITFFRDPVLWNQKNQMRGDTVIVYSKNKKIDRISLRTKAFSISVDTLENFNQAKGKYIWAIFENNQIKYVNVKTDAESIYFALAGDSAVTGLNYITSDSISVRFKDKKVKNIGFYKKPTAKLIPEHEITDNDLRLGGFKWRIKERPDLPTVLGSYLTKILNDNRKKSHNKL